MVSGNFIGTDVTGTLALANNSGITIVDGAKFNTIGGTTSGERNIISGNREGGVEILSAGTEQNTVSGNYIGTDVTGTVAVGTGLGIDLRDGSQSNTIGGTTAGERNILSGNLEDGVRITGGSRPTTYVVGDFVVEDGKFVLEMGETPYWDYDALLRIPTIPRGLPPFGPSGRSAPGHR